MVKMFVIFYFACVFICVDCTIVAEKPCQALNGGAGSCIALDSCPPVMEILQTLRYNIRMTILRQSHCGFDELRKDMPKVCCPIPSATPAPPVLNTPHPVVSTLPPVVTPLLVASTALPVATTSPLTPQPNSEQSVNSQSSKESVEETCMTVFNTTGSCRDLYFCDQFLVIAANASNNPEAIDLLKRSVCRLDRTRPMVCCPIPSATPAVPVVSTPLPVVNTPLSRATTLLPTPQPNWSHLAVNSRGTIESLGETCTTVFNTTGGCKDIYFCDQFLEIARNASSSPEATDVLKRSVCGYNQNRPKVCCPITKVSDVPPLVRTTPVPSIYPSKPVPDLRKQPSSLRAFLPSLPEPPVCGVSNRSLDRVVGGVPAKLGALPWMALIAYKDARVPTGVDWKCGGSLVSSRHVLTAAHCIHNMEESIYLVRLGELDLAREDDGATPMDVLIVDNIKHEQYTANKAIINDIGILVLEKDVTFTALIRPICLPTNSTHRSMTFEDYNPFVAGWGNLKTNSIAATHLQVAQVTVTSQGICEKAYSEVKGLFDRALCAGVPGGKVDSCKGDSGGPLILPLLQPTDLHYYYYAIGVVSGGRRCADQAGSPGVYSRVSYYMPWIEQQLLGTS